MSCAKLGVLTGLLAALGLAAPGLARAQADCEGTPGAARLIIHVDGVRSDRGLMTASLYPGDKSQFLVKNGALKVWSAPAKTGVTTLCIWLKAAGDYAVAVYHDANSNHRFDHNLLGPTEAYGFSKNPRIFLSPPDYEAVRFAAGPGDTTIEIHLRYP
jgi:uncharacterized protein (DUF2141 family)